MKSFADPGNTLPVINVGTADRGIVTFDEERDYHCHIPCPIFSATRGNMLLS